MAVSGFVWLTTAFSTVAAEKPNVILILADDLGWSDTSVTGSKYYRTGTEYHLDFSVNQFLNENFLVGIRGYHYQQLSGDSGRGTKLGDFKSESFGMGPGFAWIPKDTNGDLVISGKWLHDFDADNRFESEYFTLAAAWKF